MDELAAPAIDVVERDEVRITPDQHKRVYLDWMRNIRPWCISRQLWWGHRLPVCYSPHGEEIVAESEQLAREAAIERGIDPDSLRQSDDVLDTWFSSALWPFATLGWPDPDAPRLRAFYPTDALVTGRDIIFLWVARMVMMGIEFAGTIPFEDVFITPMIQAPDGRRMSKSLGTGIDPLDEIDVHGADALRFGLLAMSSSQDVRYSAAKVQQGRDLANKIWNASRLVLLNAGDARPERRAVRGRGPLDPLAPRANRRLGEREHRLLRLRSRGARLLRVLLVGALRLVSGDRQAAALRRRRGRGRQPARGPRAGARGRPSADAVRDRGGMGLSARTASSCCSSRRSLSPTTTSSTRAPSARSAPRSTSSATVRRWRDLVGVPAGSVLRRGPRATEPHELVARLARLRFEDADGEALATIARDRAPRLRGDRLGRGPAADRGRTRAAAGRDRAPRAQARQPGLRRQGAAGGGRGRARKLDGYRRRAGRAGLAPLAWSAEQAEAYLASLEPLGIRFGLERIRRLVIRARACRSTDSRRSTSSARTASPRSPR